MLKLLVLFAASLLVSRSNAVQPQPHHFFFYSRAAAAQETEAAAGQKYKTRQELSEFAAKDPSGFKRLMYCVLHLGRLC